MIGDPENAPNLATILATLPIINRGFACALFQSCKDTQYVNQFPPISNCAGFFEYQGYSGAYPVVLMLLWCVCVCVPIFM